MNSNDLTRPHPKYWCLRGEYRSTLLQAGEIWRWVKNAYPKWLALINGTCGPIPGGSILTHTHIAYSEAKVKGNHHLQGNVQVYHVRIPV